MVSLSAGASGADLPFPFLHEDMAASLAFYLASLMLGRTP